MSIDIKEISNESHQLHFNSILVDTHNDTMMKVINPITWLPRKDIGLDTGLQVDIPKLKRGGINALFFSAFTSGFLRNTYERSNSIILALLNALYWTEAKNRDSLQIAASHQELLAIVKGGKIAAVPTIEGAYSLSEENGIELLRQYYDIGVRGIALQWNYSNALGEGTSRKFKNGTPSAGGLTSLGINVVREMNRLGIIIDVSHMSEATFWDVLHHSNAPVIASHSGAFGIKNHPRNLTDNQLKALASKGGVIQVVFFPGFLGDGPITTSNIVDHIDYIVNLVGIDFVGLGSDFDGARMPLDLQDSSYVYLITEELVKRGYSPTDIEKILGQNSLRLFKQVEDKAHLTSEAEKSPFEIRPAFAFGGMLNAASPLLAAELKLMDEIKIDPSSIRVILDGIAHLGDYDEGRQLISLQVKEPLREKFHVVTFEARDFLGNPARATTVFYINRNWLTIAKTLVKI